MIISRLERFEADQYDDLENYFIRNDELLQNLQQPLFPYKISTLSDIAGQIGKVLIISTDEMTAPLLDFSIENQERAKRVYMLLGDDSKNKSAIDKSAGSCLIRTGVNQSGTIILTFDDNMKIRAWFCPCRVFDHNHLIEAHTDSNWLYQSFCQTFWYYSKKEFLEPGKGRSLNADQMPLMRIHPKEQYSRPGKLLESIKNEFVNAENISIYSKLGSHQWIDELIPDLDMKLINLFFNTEKNNKSAKISNFCNHVDELYLNETFELPANIICGSDKSLILPESIDPVSVNWICTTQIVTDAIAKMNRDWSFIRSGSVQSISSDRLIFADAIEKIFNVSDTCERNLGAVHAKTLDDYLNRNAKEICSGLSQGVNPLENSYCKKIKFSAEIRPPKLSKEAKKSPLEVRWAEVCEEWTDEMERLQSRINNHRSVLDDSSVKKFLTKLILGDSKVMETFEGRIQQLREIDLSRASPSVQTSALKEYKDLINQMSDSFRRSEKRIRFEKEYQKWKEGREKLENDIESLKKNLEEAEAEVIE